MPTREEIVAELDRCRDQPGRFNTTILGRAPYWARQRQIAESVRDHPVTLVQTGNMIGKKFAAAGIIHEFACLHPGCLVLATAPTQVQLEEVLWKEVMRADSGALVPLGGRARKSPLKIDYGDGWQVLAYSTTQVERFSGHHAADLLVVVDEASGVDDDIYEAIRSLGPSRELLIGNPLRPDGHFFERCQRTRADTSGRVNLIEVSSLESPHVDMDRSPWGLADRSWLEAARNDYGEGSMWWVSHVLGLFPDAGEDTLVPRSWLDATAKHAHERGGRIRIAIDLAEGRGAARSVVLARDDNGIIDIWCSATASMAEVAERVSAMVAKHRAETRDVTWDATGVGADFHNRLSAVWIKDAKPYRGGLGGGARYANLRSAAAWMLRQRLDPDRMVTDPRGKPCRQHPFSIRPDHLVLLREEVQGLRYQSAKSGAVELEPKERLSARLRRSPDIADALIMSFAFPG